MGTRKRKPQSLPVTHLITLKFPHRQQTLSQAPELHQTHPSVLPVLLPLHHPHRTTDTLAQFTDLLLEFRMDHGHVQYFRGWVEVGDLELSLTGVIMLFLILSDFLKHQCFVVGVEHLEDHLGVVEFILGLDSVKQSLKLNKSTVLFLDEDDLADPAEVGEDVVDAVVIVVIGQRAYEEHW